MQPLFYASAIPPHIRVGQFVADEPRLGWAFPLMRQFPKAEVYVVGGTARDAVKGVLPKGIHVIVRGLPLPVLNDRLKKMGLTDTKDDATIFFRPDHFREQSPLEVSIPVDTYPNPHASLLADLGQRDFTMNAMAYSLNSGLLIDPFGGARDLHAHTLTAVGRPSARFSERPRRTLRALRIAAEHAYKIDHGTWQALKSHLPTLQQVISADDGSAIFATPRAHIGNEFLRTLEGHPHYGFKLWRDSGASSLFTPELETLNDIRHRGGETGLERTERTLNDLGHPVPTLVFAALLAHLEESALQSAKNIIVRLHLHNAHPHFDYANALWMLEHRNILEEAEPEHMPSSVFEHIFGKERGQHLLTFLHATHRARGQHTRTRDRLHQATKRRQELVTDIRKPQLIRGRDLENLGVQPGPKYRKILAKIRDAQLDGHVSNKDEALNYARNLIAAQVY
ncbi:MAG: poly(A) polymerase [Patescibacteria group bacterium]|nr:poly(A) polymerase [Patescibacteria group bacterium]